MCEIFLHTNAVRTICYIVCNQLDTIEYLLSILPSETSGSLEWPDKTEQLNSKEKYEPSRLWLIIDPSQGKKSWIRNFVSNHSDTAIESKTKSLEAAVYNTVPWNQAHAENVLPMCKTFALRFGLTFAWGRQRGWGIAKTVKS